MHFPPSNAVRAREEEGCSVASPRLPLGPSAPREIRARVTCQVRSRSTAPAWPSPALSNSLRAPRAVTICETTGHGK